MFVVESSSTGADILYLIVPSGKECLVVRLLWGTEGVPASDGTRLRLVVKALEREEDMIADGRDSENSAKIANSGSIKKKRKLSPPSKQN